MAIDTSTTLGSDLAFVINVHERLVRDFPLTPYNIWCRRVHESHKPAKEKWADLLAWELNPREYKNPTLFAADHQLRCLLGKFSAEGEEDESGKETAYRKFLESERRCGAVNEMLASRIRPSGVNQILEYSKKIVADCLRPVEEFFEWFSTHLDAKDSSGSTLFELAELEKQGLLADLPPGAEFGPGVSVSGKGSSLNSVVQKLELGTVTPECWALMRSVLSALNLPRPTLVKGSVLVFVPKKVGEMRSICFEPSVNMLVQKIVGKFIRGRLKAYFGIDIRDQSRNKYHALLGALTGNWATIDLSSASDLIASMIVLELLPPRWFAIFDALRSKGYTDPATGEFHLFEKFSSMGNGFTFELETLVFAAVSLAAIRIWGDPDFSRREVVVYGDDICIPARFYNIVCQGLTVIGHIPNLSKSFNTGPFRESCGGDYFDGWDVTPLRIKELSLENPRSVINLHNRLFALSERGLRPSLVGLWCDRALAFIRNWLVSHYPRVSGGRPELIYDKKQGIYSLVSSDQWIWGDSRNSVPSAYQRHVECAKWICVERDDIVVEYHVPSTCVNWLIGLKQGASVLSERTIGFVRNPESLAPRKDGARKSPFPAARRRQDAARRGKQGDSQRFAA